MLDSSHLTVISSGSSESCGDVCSCIISAVGLGSKAAVQIFSKNCRTPVECRIESHSLFYSHKRLFVVVEPLKWCIAL